MQIILNKYCISHIYFINFKRGLGLNKALRSVIFNFTILTLINLIHE